MRKPSANRNYFTKETEDWIIKYNSCTDIDTRNKIFTDHIYYPFYKLAENIIHTFKFYHIDVDQIEDLKLDIVSMLVQEKIHLFDPSKGAKAYSYFGTIVKRWLIAYSNKNYRQKTRQVPLDAYVDHFVENKEFEDSNTVTLSKFMDLWIQDVTKNMNEIFIKDTDRDIAEAVLIVFRSRQNLEILKKKALYVYVREITGCETPCITKVILKLKDNFYEKYSRACEEGLIGDDSSGDPYLL